MEREAKKRTGGREKRAGREEKVAIASIEAAKEKDRDEDYRSFWARKLLAL